MRPVNFSMSTSGLRILWVNDLASYYGGCERYVAGTAERLRAGGHESVLLYDVNRTTDAAFLRCFDEAFGMVSIKEQLASLKPDLIYLHQLRDLDLVRQIQDHADCPILQFLHDHRYFCLREHKITTLGKEVCRKTASAANCYPCLGFVNKSERWPGITLKRIGQLESERRQISESDGFVVGSHYMQGHVAEHDIPVDQIHRIPLYSDATPAPAGSADKTDTFVFVGNYLAGKGIDVLLDGFAKAKTNARLCIIGGKGDDQPYRDQASQLGITNRVDFESGLARDEVLRRLRDGLATVIPSRNPETFGLVAVESISQRTPVIGTDAGATGEWIEDGINGYRFPTDDSDALAKCLERIAADPDKAATMGDQSYQLYQQRFTPEAHLDALVQLFRDTIESTPERRTAHA